MGHIEGGKLVLEGDPEPRPEGRRFTVIIDDDDGGFHLDDASQEELLEAAREIERGEYVTAEQLFKKLKQLK